MSSQECSPISSEIEAQFWQGLVAVNVVKSKKALKKAKSQPVVKLCFFEKAGETGVYEHGERGS